MRAAGFSRGRPRGHHENDVAPGPSQVWRSPWWVLPFILEGMWSSPPSCLKTAWDLADFSILGGTGQGTRNLTNYHKTLYTPTPNINIANKVEHGQFGKLTENSLSSEIMLAGYFSVSLGEERTFSTAIPLPTLGMRSGGSWDWWPACVISGSLEVRRNLLLDRWHMGPQCLAVRFQHSRRTANWSCTA